jgi:glycerate kinase
MAQASGLELVGGAERNDPVAASSAGTGELIVEALDAGARRVIVGLGGSATTDGGLGRPAGAAPPGRLKGVELVVAYDSRVPFLDAATVFAPQKGATARAGRAATTPARAPRPGVPRRARHRRARARGCRGRRRARRRAGGGRRELVSGFDLVADEVGLDERSRAPTS